MKKVAKAIVHCNDYNGHSGHWLMEVTDFRYNDGNYMHVAHIDNVKNGVATTIRNGKWAIFGDWSAKPAA